MKIKVKLPELEQRATGLYDASAGVKLGAPELREDTAFPKIVGYAAVFNMLSEPLFMGVREKIRPGAFSRALSEGQDVRALVDHKPSMILGRTKAGTLRLNEDQHGLRYEIDPPDTNVGRDILVSLRRKDIDQSSFGFSVKEEEYSIRNDIVTREIIEIETLYDVSPVTYPAYPQTSVNVRSLWPNMTSEEAVTSAASWFRNIKEALAPKRLLPDFERRLRLRRLQMIEKRIDSQKEDRVAKEVQKVMFNRISWTEERAKKWLTDHNFAGDKMDTSANYFHFRQFEPSKCKEGTYITMTDNMPRGISMGVCEKIS